MHRTCSLSSSSFVDSNIKHSLEQLHSPSVQERVRLSCLEEGGQKAFPEMGAFKMGFEDRSCAEMDIRAVGNNAGRVPGSVICSIWPSCKECIGQPQQIRLDRQELGLAMWP